MFKQITKCRICGNSSLSPILDLGSLALCGTFPAKGEKVADAPLSLVKCDESKPNSCGLVQLEHTYNLTELYGLNYGYRSSLNASMVEHLKGRLASALRFVNLKKGDVVIDIGSNDCTTLKNYTQEGLTRVGVDPTIAKFKEYYPSDVVQVPDFFSSARVKREIGNKTAKVISSIAMFYDLEEPTQFMREIHELMDNDGVWLFEQSYMPDMLEKTSYDTICHEHLEYYGMRQVQWMAEQVGFKIVDVELTSANGGSFSVIAAKTSSKLPATPKVAELIERETSLNLNRLEGYSSFSDRVRQHREVLPARIAHLMRDGKRVLGYGASTKGNVILQYCGLGPKQIPYICEVNEDKFGHFTPGTLIPIQGEKSENLTADDVLMPLPWHFRAFFDKKLQPFVARGGSILYPLPDVELVTGNT